MYDWTFRICPDSQYTGQSSNNNYTRGNQHEGSYKNWSKYEYNETNNRGKKYSKPSNNSFMYDHQKEKHNSSPLDCKLNTKRYYGKDRLACQVAEAVPLKMRTGEILNTKGGEFYNPPLVSIRQEIQRGLRNMT